MLSRRLSQKPSEDFLSDFKRQYSQVLPAHEVQTSHQPETTTNTDGQTPNLAFDLSSFEGYSGRNNGHFTSSGSLDVPSEFKTCGLVDPNVDGFQDFTVPGGFWPPTPQGSAQYLDGPGTVHGGHDPFSINTPVSGGAHHLTFPHAQGPGYSHDFMGPHRMNTFPGSQQHFEPPHGIAPDSFHQHEPHIRHIDTQSHGLHLSDVSLGQGYEPTPSSAARLRAAALDSIGPPPVVDAMNKFRFRTILKAQTAMIKHPKDVPVTYLNKSQTYTVHIEDSILGHAMADPSLKYRTAIRISFEDEQQRKTPAASWQLWNEGRGTNEALKRGVKPRAVEYVSPDQSQTDTRSNLQPITENFDGFSVVWSPNGDGMAHCNIQLRFNFLSTDFSHSKGVKGVPVRLCAKTELIEGPRNFQPEAVNREISYCAVKIFRDHGAERKLANDKTHIDKLIDKFTTQAEQAEAGAKEGGKRRRSDSIISGRPTKVPKHRRTWSMSSSDGMDDPAEAEDELQVRIRSLKAMPDSVRPVSAFYLPGEEQDDLDSHPVPPLAPTPPSGSPSRGKPPSLKTDTTQTSSRSTVGYQSETPTSRSPSVMRLRPDSASQFPAPLDATPTIHSRSPVKQEVYQRTTPQQLASPPSSGPMKARKEPPTSTPLLQVNNALDVDQTYQPPSDRKSRAVAELFVKPSMSWRPPVDDNYRAIYLMNRTLNELIRAVCIKCGIDPYAIICTVRVNDQGLPITVDDEMVEQMPERQDFIAELDVAEDTHGSAAQFFADEDDSADTGTKYKLTLRY